MAAITPKEKDDKIIAYKFRACVGRDENGRQVSRATTWQVPENLSIVCERGPIFGDTDAVQNERGGIDMSILGAVIVPHPPLIIPTEICIVPTLSPKDPNFPAWWEAHKGEWEK